MVTRCDCHLDARMALLLKAARIPARYEHCILADFSTDYSGAHRSLAAARLSAGRFVEEYPVEKTGLLFIGPIGTGKTHLAVGIIPVTWSEIMNTTPITRKKPTPVSAKSVVTLPLARETSVLRARAEAFQQAVIDLEKAFAGGKGPHPPLPGPGGHLLAAVYSSLGNLLQSAATLNKQIAGSLKTAAS